jgi:hypothetical protein
MWAGTENLEKENDQHEAELKQVSQPPSSATALFPEWA